MPVILGQILSAPWLSVEFVALLFEPTPCVTIAYPESALSEIVVGTCALMHVSAQPSIASQAPSATKVATVPPTITTEPPVGPEPNLLPVIVIMPSVSAAAYSRAPSFVPSGAVKEVMSG